MTNAELTDELKVKYEELKGDIKNRLNEFANVPKDKYFYELCFCICTPQSKAKNAFVVQNYLEEKDYFNNPFDVTELLRRNENYIRFHNQKAQRIANARETFDQILEIIEAPTDARFKRDWFVKNFNGFGMKESGHLLRNLGFRGLAILDRHILRMLVSCGVFDEVPVISPVKKYLDVENKFLEFSDKIGIEIDELDLLFFAYNTGEILK